MTCNCRLGYSAHLKRERERERERKREREMDDGFGFTVWGRKVRINVRSLGSGVSAVLVRGSRLVFMM